MASQPNQHVPAVKVAPEPEPTQAMQELSQPSEQDQAAAQTTGIKLPSVEDLKKQVESGEVPPTASSAPQFVPGHIDTAAFLRAQHRYIEVQTWFFSTSHNGHYEQALLTYSKAQGEYISALSEVLKSLGVV